jgi:hypothetical protein
VAVVVIVIVVAVAAAAVVVVAVGVVGVVDVVDVVVAQDAVGIAVAVGDGAVTGGVVLVAAHAVAAGAAADVSAASCWSKLGVAVVDSKRGLRTIEIKRFCTFLH